MTNPDEIPLTTPPTSAVEPACGLSQNTPPNPAQPWLILALIGLCCAIEMLLLLGDAGILPYPRLRQTAYEYAGFWPGLLGAWQPNYPAQPYLMFLTYAFLHSGPLHLGFNMAALWSLGRGVQERLGASGFAEIYAASVLAGGLGFGILATTPQPMVGASGGLFGLAGALLAWDLRDRRALAEPLWPVPTMVILLLLLNLLQGWLMHGLLAWQTHLGGFIIGWIMATLKPGTPPSGER